MIKEFLNCTAEGTEHDLFNISEDRMHKFIDELDVCTEEIANNYKDYTYVGTEQHAGRTGLHVGRILERQLQLATTEQEELLILFLLAETMEQVQIRVTQIQINKFLDFGKQLNNK